MGLEAVRIASSCHAWDVLEQRAIPRVVLEDVGRIAVHQGEGRRARHNNRDVAKHRMLESIRPNRNHGVDGDSNLETALRVEIEIAASALRFAVERNAFRGTAGRVPNDGPPGPASAQLSLQSCDPATVFEGPRTVATVL